MYILVNRTHPKIPGIFEKATGYNFQDSWFIVCDEYGYKNYFATNTIEDIVIQEKK